MINEHELEILMDVTQIALQNATASLHNLLKDEVLVKESVFGKEAVLEDMRQYAEKNTDVKILFTEVVGPVSGKSYVLLDNDSFVKICNHLLPDSVAGQAEMRQGIALELDNILIAALVTKFSNLLNLPQMHGHVPHYSENNLENFIAETENLKSSFSFSINLKSFKKLIRFKLIVVFDESLDSQIHAFSREDAFVGKKEKEQPKDESSKVGGFFKKIFHI